ncbi:hypothetical protein BGZ61DRAFT_525510 [Ilyonectria robusta]|uniref:uncharacterized protein n=1 Tax=Ilyonectria robusta TaxID=1079257 RepID=UPI001E8DDB7A|nr:uncharacterized protein BGZ61DRAFT_525510 [Ilyonectria robusta]KAH8737365.1 hypothetical protein BGZ61DRAFT_525510 [Ilyonectria robusta]
MDLSGHEYEEGLPHPFNASSVNHRHGGHGDNFELPTEEKLESVDGTTMETFLDDQEQKSSVSLSTPNTESEAEGPSLIDLVKGGFDQITGSLSALSKQVHDPRNSKEIARIKKQLEDATEKDLRLTTENAALEIIINTTNEKLRYATERNLRLTAAHKALAMKLHNTNSKLDRALQDRNAQRCNADGDALADSRKATDDTVQSKWKQLDYNIRSLAHYLAASLPKQIMGSLSKAKFRRLHPSWRKFLEDDDFREPFLECYLWHVVTNQVFDASGNIHGGQSDIPRSIKSTQKKMMARAVKSEHHASLYQRLARWRAQGSALFEELRDSNEKQLNDVISAETRLLRPFWSEKPGSSDRSEVKTWDEMKGILEGALELDRLLMGSKAIFKACWENSMRKTANPLRYNPHKMDVVASNHPISARSQVTFFTSPVLFKVGNADGQNYDKVAVLVKASVVCD